jgi:hypothetical protein
VLQALLITLLQVHMETLLMVWLSLSGECNLSLVKAIHTIK